MLIKARAKLGADQGASALGRALFSSRTRRWRCFSSMAHERRGATISITPSFSTH